MLPDKMKISSIVHDGKRLRVTAVKRRDWLERNTNYDDSRPGDFACVMACDENQVVAIFDLLVDREVLDAGRSAECRQCQNLMSHTDFRHRL